MLRDRIGAATDGPLEYLCATAARWLGGPVGPDSGGLLDLGVGSLNTARLTAEIACRYGAQLHLSEAVRVPSLRYLAGLVLRHRP